MTVENLWYNGKMYKGENLEKKGKDFNYEYDRNDEHFDQLRKCAVMNSTAVFTSELPDKEIKRLNEIKSKKPGSYDEEMRKAQAKWQEQLKTFPFHKRKMIGDASEIALMKFFQPFEDIL